MGRGSLGEGPSPFSAAHLAGPLAVAPPHHDPGLLGSCWQEQKWADRHSPSFSIIEQSLEGFGAETMV